MLGLGLGTHKAPRLGAYDTPDIIFGAGLDYHYDPLGSRIFGSRCAVDGTTTGNYLSNANAGNVFNTNGSFTCLAWVLMDSISGNSQIINVWNATGNLRSWSLTRVANQMYAFISNDGIANPSVASTPTVGTGTWYQVAFIYDADAQTIGIKIDNNAIDSAAHLTGMYEANQALTFCESGTGTDAHNGGIDSVSFWTRALTNAEIDTLYNGGSGTAYNDFTDAQKVGLVSHWGMDSGNNTTRPDHHGNYDLASTGTTNARDGKLSEKPIDTSIIKSIIDSPNGSAIINQNTPNFQSVYTDNQLNSQPAWIWNGTTQFAANADRSDYRTYFEGATDTVMWGVFYLPADEGHAHFLWDNSSSGTQRGFRMVVDTGANTLRLVVGAGGVSVASYTIGTYTYGNWVYFMVGFNTGTGDYEGIYNGGALSTYTPLAAHGVGNSQVDFYTGRNSGTLYSNFSFCEIGFAQGKTVNEVEADMKKYFKGRYGL